MATATLAPPAPVGPRYKWVALSNTTLGMLMAGLDGSIVIIALPAIFRGINLDPLDPGNIAYLLWMVLGYLLVVAVLVVPLGRLGDLYGRVRMYNLGFLVFSLASLALSLDPFTGHQGAIWLIVGRMIQATGGAMIMANSAAILTDAFPPDRRGMALGVNQISALAGQFLGLLAGGLLAQIDWRAVFWVNVPIGIIGTIWSYRSLRDNGIRRPAKIDWAGNLTFTAGLSMLLIGITGGIQPYGSSSVGWGNPTVIAELAAGIALLIIFCLIEQHVAEPMFRLSLFRIRSFAAANIAALAVAMSRGGLQFMLIIWLQGVWLPLHGYDYEQTPIWAGIYLLPLTIGFLISGPLSGYLSDRFGTKLFAIAGLTLLTLSFAALAIIPVIFSYPLFVIIVGINGIGQGMFSSPNTSTIMNSVPADQRGAASGMRATFQNSGMALSIGFFFSLMAAGLAGSLPSALSTGLMQQGVPADVATQVSSLSPVGTLFAAFLGSNPIGHLLASTGVLQQLPASNVSVLTGTDFFPQLISGPFHQGLIVVFGASVVLCLVAIVATLLRSSGKPAN